MVPFPVEGFKKPLGVRAQIAPYPFNGARAVVAPQSIGAHQNIPAPACGLGEAQRMGQQRLAVIAPTAQGFEPGIPVMLIRLADDHPA